MGLDVIPVLISFHYTHLSFYNFCATCHHHHRHPSLDLQINSSSRGVRSHSHSHTHTRYKHNPFTLNRKSKQEWLYWDYCVMKPECVCVWYGWFAFDAKYPSIPYFSIFRLKKKLERARVSMWVGVCVCLCAMLFGIKSSVENPKTMSAVMID